MSGSVFRLIIGAGLVFGLTACGEGVLHIEPGAHEQTFAPAESREPGETTGGGFVDQDGNFVPGLTDQTSTDQDPQVPTLLHNATVGERCVGGATVRYLVLSDSSSTCAVDAERIDATSSGTELAGAIAIALDEANEQIHDVRYCVAAGDCRDVTLTLALEPEGTTLRGSWSGAPAGMEQTTNFEAAPCAFDEVLEPLPSDTPAAGISVNEVAIYQGVKIPLVAEGAVVADRNAPVVAGRPGVVRVFVAPQADWQARDIVVRLTIGDVVKEETFRPSGPSVETEGGSTVNFEIATGELQGDGAYSVELLEAASCAPVSGAIARPRVPESGAQPLQLEALASKLRVVLVPIQYDADGSGRLPDLSADAVERFRNEIFTHYPIHDVEVTVRDAVATGQALAPNGSGFGPMLNLCLNVRANDNPDPDVYYYCAIQPASSKTGFCGGGCVGGVAPLASANDVGSRGGIGISFGGDGEGIFVHEIGHALGRPHSPCGGAAGTDPNYPHAQGLIGSWGFNILTGQLFPPSQVADFMGYCNPTWVSDYTYGEIFDRLSFVLGAQAFRIQTPPTRWRTAVVEGNGTFAWGGDLTLSHLPGGTATAAALRSPSGDTVGSPTVYVTPIADIDAFLLTIEDTGSAVGTIDVPGIGQLTLN